MSYSKVSSPSQQNEWEIICASALSRFKDVCDKAMTGRVSMYEITLLKSKKEQVIGFCSASLPDIPSLSEMQSCIFEREEEYKFFQDFKVKLSDFINHLKDVSIKGKPEYLKVWVGPAIFNGNT